MRVNRPGWRGLRISRGWSRDEDGLGPLADPFPAHGTPAHIRPGQGPESVAEAAKARIAGVGSETA